MPPRTTIDAMNSRHATAAALTVRAPARLHLGFIDLDGSMGRRFGSVGLTLNGLGTVVDGCEQEGSEKNCRRQLAGREMPLCAGLDLPALGVERPGYLALEAVESTGDAHDGQHQAGADAKEPVQLEDDFLEHDGATLALTHCEGRPLYMGIIFITIHLRVIYASTARPGSISYRLI